jgi:hypothetical protein
MGIGAPTAGTAFCTEWVWPVCNPDFGRQVRDHPPIPKATRIREILASHGAAPDRPYIPIQRSGLFQAKPRPVSPSLSGKWLVQWNKRGTISGV